MPNCNNSLTILHLNIRSLNNNFNQLHEFLVSIRIRPDVICLTETRIKNDPLVNITISQYKFYHVDSQISASGVVVYVFDNFTSKLCPNQYVMPNSECLLLELSTPISNEKFTVGTIYRHPDYSTVNNFLDRFSDCLNDLSNSKKTYYILGDFNINIQKFNRTNAAQNYINLIVSNGAIPIITKPARVTPESSSIIDHIITNDSNHQIKSFIFEVDVSDHYPILCKIDKRKSNFSKNHSDVYFRNKSKFTPVIFCEDLKNNLDLFFFNLPLLTKDNFNENFEKFTNIVSSTIDKHAPLTKLSRRQLKLYSKLWLTKGIINSIKNKRKMFKSQYILGAEREKSYFKKYINVLTKIKTISKKRYYETKLKESKSDLRQIWNTIRSVLPTNRKNVTATSPCLLKINDCSVSAPHDIANYLNDYF